MPRLRIATRMAVLLVVLTLALALHGAWRLARLPSPWPRLFLRAAGRIVGARVRVSGQPRRRDVVLVANHLSWVDIPILAGVTGAAFVAKGELAETPVLGWLSRLNRTLFVSRADRMGVSRQVDELRAALADGWPVAIFPEGTTGDGAELLPFKPALLAALEPPPPGVVVQPVRIDYEASELAWVGDEPGLDHARRVLGRRGGWVATLTFLEPLDPAALPGRKAIAAAARDAVTAAAPLAGAGGNG